MSSPSDPCAVSLLRRNLDQVDWEAAGEQWWQRGFAIIPQLLGEATCDTLVSMYEGDHFRSTVEMSRYRFGEGQYRYFDYPLPDVIDGLRHELYRRLAPWANRLACALRRDWRYPESFAAFQKICRDAGQTQATPLLLRYRCGGYNRLHRDLYGTTVFPLQSTVLLSDSSDFSGGEFVLVENRPRQQAIASVVPLQRGDMVIFSVYERAVVGARKTLAASVRHGVSQLTAGERWALGIIFHDAA